jgi:hypothetical protein
VSRATLCLLLACVALAVGAGRIRATPERVTDNAIVCDDLCAPSRAVLGYETLVLNGATEVRWRGPFERASAMVGEGVFPVHAAPLWSSVTAVEVVGADVTRTRFIVDHALTWGEACAAAISAWPWAAGALFGVVVIAILYDGVPLHAAVLAFVLATIRAWSPAWNLDSDPARYWAGARAVLAGRAPDTLWPPGWSIALVPAAWTGEVVVGRMIGAVVFALCPLLAARVVGGRAAVAAAVFTAVSAELLGFAPSLYSEPLFVFIGLAALGATRPGAVGLLGAAAALTRAHALFVVPLVWLSGRGRRTRGVGVFVTCLALPVLAWSVVPSVHLGRPVLISDNVGMNLWIGHRPSADGDWHDPGPAPAEGYGEAALSAMAADPGAAALRVAHNVQRLWNASTSDRTLATRPLGLPLAPFPVLVGFAAIGAVARPRASLLVWLAATTVVTALFFAPVRYKLGLFPGLLPLAGEGVAVLAGWLASVWARRSARV